MKYSNVEIEMLQHLNKLSSQKVRYAVIVYKEAMAFLDTIETS